MIHELKHIVHTALKHKQAHLKSVLVTVVYLEGSSYRKPGVRMLVCENGTITGAISGGCVEKEVVRRSQSVFKTGKAKVITYDGRYRLGCEGILYILLEPFEVSEAFTNNFQQHLETRDGLILETYYKKEDECEGEFGTVVHLKDGEQFFFSEGFQHIFFSKEFEYEKEPLGNVFTQQLQPHFKLLIIGGEHDAVKLGAMASQLGWEVTVITSVNDPKQLSDFPGAKSVIAETPETYSFENIDTHTAVVLMTHSYVQDLKYLLKLKEHQFNYLGILGSVKRREQLQNELFEYDMELSDAFLDSIHSPAGLNIGAITPEEIALSILSEILAVTRVKDPMSLKNSTAKLQFDVE